MMTQDHANKSSEDGRIDGFGPAMTPAMARRQLRVSLTLIAAFALATVAALATGKTPEGHSERAAVKLTIEAPGATLTRHAADTDAMGRSGG